MAEAEDVITDAARHATIFARALWRRHRPAPAGPVPLRLADVAQRLDLLIAAVFGRSFALRVAQPPAAPSWAGRLLLRHQLPPVRDAFPATDGRSIWLPASFDLPEPDALATERFRTLALQQAMRAERGSAEHLPDAAAPLERELYLLLEARAAEDALVRLLPGMAGPLATLRREALQRRPKLGAFTAPLREIEELVRALLGAGSDNAFMARLPGSLDSSLFALPATPAQIRRQAQALSAALGETAAPALKGTRLLWRDWFTGELRMPPATVRASGQPAASEDEGNDTTKPRSARLSRRPEVREGDDDEDDKKPGAWMVQTASRRKKPKTRWACSAPPTATKAPPPRISPTPCRSCPKRGWCPPPANPRKC